jgi:hypothetical protein
MATAAMGETCAPTFGRGFLFFGVFSRRNRLLGGFLAIPEN